MLLPPLPLPLLLLPRCCCRLLLLLLLPLLLLLLLLLPPPPLLLLVVACWFARGLAQATKHAEPTLGAIVKARLRSTFAFRDAGARREREAAKAVAAVAGGAAADGAQVL